MAYGGVTAPTTPIASGGYTGVKAPAPVAPTPQPTFDQKLANPEGLGNVAAPVVKAGIGAYQGLTQTPTAPKDMNVIGATLDAFKGAIKQAGENIGKASYDLNPMNPNGTSLFSLKGAATEGQIAVDLVNGVFGAALSPLQGLAHVPVVGTAVDYVNKIFGAIGEGAGSGAVQVLDETPLPQDTKDTLRPLVHDTASLVAQIYAGKAAGDAGTMLKDKTASIMDTLHKGVNDVQKTLPVTSETPTETPVKVNTPTTKLAEYSQSQGYEPITPPEQLPTIQMGPKAPKVVDTLPTIDAGNGPAPKADTSGPFEGGTKLYHGTDKLNLKPQELGNGMRVLWTADSPDIAQKYIGGGSIGAKGTVHELPLPKNLKIYDATDYVGPRLYNDSAFLKSVEAQGYDGIKINDAVRYEKDLGSGPYFDKKAHTSVGLFQSGIEKVKNAANDSTLGRKTSQTDGLHSTQTTLGKSGNAPQSSSKSTIASFPSIPKELEPLAQEAQKYKSAEEFVKAQQKSPQYAIGEGSGHTAPTNGGYAAPAYDLTKIYPADVYEKGVQYYGSGYKTLDNEAMQILKKIKGNPDAEVTVYRAIPKDTNAPTLNAGDWVTLTKGYAEQHGESNLGGEYKIVSQKVKASQLFTDANSLQEFGYDPRMNQSQLTDFYNKVKGGNVAPAEKPLTYEPIKETTTTETPPKEVKVQKTGAITKAASDINATLVKQGFNELPPELQSKYTPESYKTELARTLALPAEELNAKATGEKPVGNYEGQIVFNEAKRLAIENGDGETLLKLAQSPIGKERSLAAQTLGAVGYNSVDSGIDPVKAIQDVQAAREAALKAKGTDITKETAKISSDIKAEVKKAISPRPTWEEFVHSITCGY